MDWMMFDNDEFDEIVASNMNYLSDLESTIDPHVTPSEYLEQHEYYQQFHPKWDDTLLWIMMLPEQV